MVSEERFQALEKRVGALTKCIDSLCGQKKHVRGDDRVVAYYLATDGDRFYLTGFKYSEGYIVGHGFSIYRPEKPLTRIEVEMFLSVYNREGRELGRPPMKLIIEEV